jgi:predicted molibdopterin-dependent oxidoreductase YjgC
VRFSPEIPGPRIEGTRAEWRILCELAAHVRPDLAKAFGYENAQAIRDEMEATMPVYKGIKDLREEGQHFQWGGPYLLADGVCDNMPDGRGAFSKIDLPDNVIPDGKFMLMTRRGKQFNSIVQKQHDTLAGGMRDDLFFNAEDAASLGLNESDRVRLRSEVGTMDGVCRVRSMSRGCVAAYWPEANVLITRRMDEVSGEPDYNAIVSVDKL